MIKLSDRLQMIAAEITRGETVADIGTDHGLLPIFLYETKMSPEVILCDINRGPLEKAEGNIEAYLGPEALGKEGQPGGLKLRLGDGLRPLKRGEVDTVVIAGMGGLLMTEILGENLSHAKSFSRLILQPRNGSHKLRWWLAHNGFAVTAEHLVRERRFICEILTVVPAQENREILPVPEPFPQEELDWEISPLLYESGDPLLIPFIRNKMRIEQKVVDLVAEGSREGSDHRRIAQAKERLAALQKKLEQAQA